MEEDFDPNSWLLTQAAVDAMNVGMHLFGIQRLLQPRSWVGHAELYMFEITKRLEGDSCRCEIVGARQQFNRSKGKSYTVGADKI